MRSHFESGKWNVICDRCGLKYKNTELRDEWTGLKVCHSCYETKHPQLLLRVPKERGGVPWTRPEHEEEFVRSDDALLTEILLQTIMTEQELPLYS